MLKRRQSAKRSEKEFTKEAAEQVLKNVFESSGRAYGKETAASLKRNYVVWRAWYLSAGVILLSAVVLFLGAALKQTVSWDMNANEPYQETAYREAPVPKEGEAVLSPMIVKAYIEGSRLVMDMVQGTYEVDSRRFYAMERNTKEKIGVDYDKEQCRLTMPYNARAAVYDIYLFDVEGYSYIVTVTVS